MIDHIIQKQGFEIATEMVAKIIKENIQNQLDLRASNEIIDCYLERVQPYDKSEPTVINVWLENIALSDHTNISSQQVLTINVDTILQGPENEQYTGDQVNSASLKDVTGWIRYILSHPSNKTLGMLGFIGGVYVTSVSFSDRDTNQEANGIIMSRVTLSVRVYELDNYNTFLELLSNYTTIRLDNTNRGYLLTFNND